GQQANLYDQELRAGRVSGDVMFMVDPGLFLKLARENKLTPYCSSHASEFRPEALQKDCTHIHVTAYYQYLSYNPEMIKGSDVPTSWNDLLNPKWKGKISIPDPKVGGGHYYFVFTIYKLFGKEWFEKVRANDPLLTQSHGVTHNQIMAGERVMGVNISVLARRDGPYPGGKGAPVKEAFPKEGGALLAGSMAITKGGPNPAGAKVFIEWATSLEGQKAINRLGHFSLRKDFTSVEGDDLSKIKYHWWDAEEMDKYRDQWTAEAQKILTGN
ncbi:MAG: ABC transporter substrate-binding protein, partial [Burkholderiales bacterium]